MKNYKIIALFLFSLCLCKLYAVEHVVTSGEHLRYRAHYGLLTAGYADIASTDTVVEGEKLMFTQIDFQTSNFVEKLFKIHYMFDGYYNPVDYIPEVASYHLIEGNKSWTDKTVYNRQAMSLHSEMNGEMEYEEYVRDIVSAIAYIRSTDWDAYQPNDTVSFDMYFREHDIFPLRIIYQGKETISTEFGKIPCVKLNPTSDPNKLFNGKSAITMWFSDDDNRILVLISIDVFIGSFKIDLAEYENLKYPLKLQ